MSKTNDELIYEPVFSEAPPTIDPESELDIGVETTPIHLVNEPVDQGGRTEGGINVWMLIAIALFVLLAGCTAMTFVKRFGKKPLKREQPTENLPHTVQPDVEARIAHNRVVEIGGIGNAHGIGSRKYQQDSFGISRLDNEELVERLGVLALVADGMGGLENSGEISEFVTKRMLTAFNTIDAIDPRMALAQLIADVTLGAEEKFGSSGGTGTTLAAAIIKNDRLFTASVGDSRVSLLRGGALIDLNRAHNYGMELDEEVAKGGIAPGDAKSNAKRHALTSYIGMRDLKKVDIPENPVRLLPGDKLILMSDGVYSALTEREISGLLSNISAAEGAEKLDRAVQEKHHAKQDNYTAIVLEMKGK